MERLKTISCVAVFCILLHFGYSDEELIPGDEPSNPSRDFNRDLFESAIHDYSDDKELDSQSDNEKPISKHRRKDSMRFEADFDISDNRESNRPISNYIVDKLSPKLDEYNLPNCLLDSKIGMCINDPYYPKEQISKIVESTPNLELTPPNDVMHPIHIPIDYSSSMKDETLPRQCLERIQAVYPHVGKTMEYGYVYIVNVNRYQQPMVLRSCSAQDAKCNNVPGVSGATCRQHYLNSKMKVIHPQRSEVADALVQIPSSCDCYMKQPSPILVETLGLMPDMSSNEGLANAATQLTVLGAIMTVSLQQS